MTDNVDRLTTALADGFAVERKLGVGGMATVWLAQDLRHHRKVAIKVLRPELAAVLGAERFVQEIKTTAKLQHPHILPLFDSGEADGFVYYVMPYVEGESLRAKLNREIQLGIDEAVKITTEVADALDYAHRHHVIHRDLKPENILLHDGRPMVADFGIALAVDAAGGQRLTQTGVALGTPAYMSPEQVSGEPEIDGRSDQYALACVLYELLAGEPPFRGFNVRAVLARHLTDPVPPITTVRPEVPASLTAALVKALGKTPADRFESITAFAAGLVAEAVDAGAEAKSIVVLPFENLSPDPDNAYFADGLTEEIITDLSKIRALRVISRTSAMRLKTTDKDVRTISRELAVQFVLEGSVRRVGDNVRIAAQLIDANHDTHLWAEKYAGTVDDVFDLQERLSRHIVQALQIAMTPEETGKLASRPIPNVHAYECYLRARELMYHFTVLAYERALQLLQEGLRVVGENELLYATMGSVYVEQVLWGIKVDRSYLEKAEACVTHVFELNPNSARGYALRGMIEYKMGRRAEAASQLNRALAIDPSDADALLWLVSLYQRTGQSIRGRPLARRLLETDPLTPINHIWLSFFDYWADEGGGTAEAMVAACRRWLDVEPGNALGQFNYAYCLAYYGRREEATAVLDQLCTGAPDTGLGRMAAFLRLALSGSDRATEVVTDELTQWAAWDDVGSWWMADCYALIGRAEPALDWLANAIRWGCLNYPALSRLDPLLEGVRGETRFAQLMKELKPRWEAFDA